MAPTDTIRVTSMSHKFASSVLGPLRPFQALVQVFLSATRGSTNLIPYFQQLVVVHGPLASLGQNQDFDHYQMNINEPQTPQSEIRRFKSLSICPS